MLDPLTALGVASNVLALIDFSAKIVSGAVSIYGSADGASKDHADVETVAIDLSEMTEKLSHDVRTLTLSTGVAAAPAHLLGNSPSVHQEALCKLALRCKKLADELIQTLQKLKVKKKNYRFFRSGMASIRVSLKSEDIARFKRGLDDLRSEMTARMVSLISEHQREMFGILRQQSEDRWRSDRTIKTSTDNLEDAMTSAMERLSVTPSKADLAELVAVINGLAEEWRHTTSLLKTINSLSFDSISARLAAVEPAHASTFEWTYHDNPSPNVEIPSLGGWLRTGNDIFWVTGKPGSGKSTFMKYVCMEERTKQILQVWAGHHELILASHFFWAAGTAMQRSLAGLLQSLLSDLLQKCPKLLEIAISTDRLSAPVQSQAPWTISELRECFSKIQHQTQLELRVCLFVDGLDEYEGEHEDVLEILEDLAKNPSIKLCLASRDWDVFQDWFKGRPMIRLEDLTKADIRIFTKSSLDQDRRFVILRQENSTYDDVIDLIINEAEGVFLWVVLVVKSLKRGFIAGDTVKDLTRRIKTLPKKLDDFFLEMLNSIEEVYHVQSAEILQVCQAHPDIHLSMMSVSFFDEDDFLFGTTLKVDRRLEQDELISRCEATERRIRARCRDLVMFKRYGRTDEWYIEFVHRSAKDFVQSEYIQKMLASRMREQFSAPRYLCQAIIAEAKLNPRDPVIGENGETAYLSKFNYVISRALEFSELYEKACNNGTLESMEWLDDLSSTLEAEDVEAEDVSGPEPKLNKKARLTQSLSISWLFEHMVQRGSRLYLNPLYIKHCIDPIANTEEWNLKLGPRVVANISQESVVGFYPRLILSILTFLSLGSMRGETIVDFVGNSEVNDTYVGQPLCFCVLHPFVFTTDKWWLQDEPFCQLVKEIIDEVLRKTDMQKLETSSLAAVQELCRALKTQGFSSAGIDAFIRDADLILTAEKEMPMRESRS